MIPNFALSLSFDGIALLHRVPDGWHLVGEVPLDTPDLKAALADLRRTAQRIAPDGMRTKLVIPVDQIRFMSLDTDQASQSAVEAALEGETPYTLDELVVDFTRTGGKTHIAAVARETLDEAEAFAREHGFDPVACVAVPDPGTFATEVFFDTVGGSGAVRDDRPVRQTGIARSPTEPAKDVRSGETSAPAGDDTASSDAQPAATPRAEASPVAMAGPVAKTSGDDAPAAPRGDDATPVFASRSKVAASPAAGTATTVSSGGPTGAWQTAVSGAAVPGGTAPAKLRAAMDKAEAFSPRTTPAVSAARNGVAGAGMPSAGSADRTGTTTPTATPTDPDKRPRITPDLPARTSAPAGVGVPSGQPVPAPDTEPLFTRRKEPPPPLVGKARAASAPALRANSQTDAPVSALTASAAPPVTTAPVARAPEVAPMVAADRKTRVTAPSAAVATAPATAGRPRGKPRFLGLILTAILLIVLLLIGLWASTLPPGGIAGWFRGSTADAAVAASDTTTADTLQAADTATPDLAVPADPAPVADAVVTAAVAPADVAVQPTVTEVQAVAASRAPAGRVLTPDEANRIYAATGVYQRAPRIAVTPRSSLLEGVGPIAVVAAPPVVPQPLMPTLAAAEPDAQIAAQPIPPGPNETFARDARGNILATPEGTVTPQGAVVFAGAPDLRPQVRPGTPNAPPAPAAATLPVAPVARPDSLTAAPGQAATAAPPLRPVLRPQSAAPVTSAGATPPELAPLPPYTGTRPRLRPAALVPPAAVVIAAYTGTRPVLRPAGIAPPAAPEAPIAETPEEVEPTPVADISAVAAAIAAAAPRSTFTNRTALAVSIIPRPAPRPRNFAQVVARTRTVAPPPPAAAAPTRTAAVAATPAPPTIVAPSGNISGGVARAATIDSAMNMRQMNLVGVYGKPNARRALVRLGNGRYVKVEVGSRLDGGQVTAIGDTALNFVKRGKTYALTLPG